MKLDKFHKIIKNTPPEVRENIKFSMKVQERIHELLGEKFQGRQKSLADKMGTSEAAISKLLSGLQNYKIKTLMKLQIAFDAPIIAVCTVTSDNSTYVEVKMTHQIPCTSFEISVSGNLTENTIEYKDFKPLKIAQ